MCIRDRYMIKELLEVDQKEGSFGVNGFFRVAWRDDRLAFDRNSTCGNRLTFTNADHLWTPDIYFGRALHLTMGTDKLKASGLAGEMVHWYSDGRIVWSRLVRARLKCEMYFGRLPFDQQACLLLIGMYANTDNDVHVRCPRMPKVKCTPSSLLCICPAA